MSSAILIGSSRVGEVMARLLCSAGVRVKLMGAAARTEDNITQMLREDVEETIPFQFVDDIRHQESLLKNHLANLTISNDATSIPEDAAVIFDASVGYNPERNLLRRLRPSIPIVSLATQSSVSDAVLHLYQPMEITKMAKVALCSPNGEKTLEALREVLKKAGIVELTSAQGILADRVLSDSQSVPKPRLGELISSILPERQVVDYSHFIMH